MHVLPTTTTIMNFFVCLFALTGAFECFSKASSAYLLQAFTSSLLLVFDFEAIAN